MTTELQQQLAVHRKKHGINDSSKLGRKSQPSLFLTPSEAAAIDISVVYETSCEGLRTLAQYDERFEEFHETLLHPTSVDLQRDLKTLQVIS